MGISLYFTKESYKMEYSFREISQGSPQFIENDVNNLSLITHTSLL